MYPDFSKNLPKSVFQACELKAFFKCSPIISIFPNVSSRACYVNFCRTFISSISSFLELAGPNLAQALLSLYRVIRHRLFLLNMSVVFVNAEKCSAQNRVVFIKP